MNPIVDTTKFRDHIKRAFRLAASADRTPKYEEGEGVEEVPADDQELLGEGSDNPPLTVKHWAGWVYQKRDNGTWDKLCPSPKSKFKKRHKEPE